MRVSRFSSVALVAVAVLLAAAGAVRAQDTFEKRNDFDTELAPGGPMPAAEVAAGIRVPVGFRASLFAAEPDVRQPIAITTDARGRLWVAENYSYSERTVGWHPELRDRIVILEDADNDGRFDKRTVFWDDAPRLTSIEIGLGGVWAISLPNLMFIPDRNGDDVPDGPPEVVLDGFEFVRGRHNVANGLRWGPDGWLYGRHGILSTSHVGPPGASDAGRLALNVGIWRYHPRRRTLERVCEGTTNPWGMDWDAHGEMFFINTVIGHLWHGIPGAHFRRMFGDDPNPRVYELIDQHADHVHWATGETWTDVRKGVTGATLSAGGGHAHTGLLIYQGGQWPREWKGRLLTINFHGRRLNVERLEREGSALIGRHEPDAFLFPDPRFRGLDLIAAPDGGVFVSDWNDDGECHDHDGVHRSSGRIFKLSYGELRPAPRDLGRASNDELVAAQRSENDWLARQARRVLIDRAASGPLTAAVRQALVEMLRASDGGVVPRLRALWTLYGTDAADEDTLRGLLNDPAEPVRIWAVRLLTDDRGRGVSEQTAAALVARAQQDGSAPVRLALASALQRLPLALRARLAPGLLARAEDAADHNLPLMLWYGIEPLAAAGAVPGFSFEKMIAAGRVPRVQRLAARRLAEEFDTAPVRVDELLAAIATGTSRESRQAVLDGIAQGLSGRRKAPKPANWDALQGLLAAGADQTLRDRLRDLGALFGDGRALDDVKRVALDSGADLPQRRAALQVLVQSRAPSLREVCLTLLKERGLSAVAATGLATLDDPALADAMLAEWDDLYGNERPPVIEALVSRPSWAAKLLEAIAAGRVQRSSLSASHARQIRSHGEPGLERQLEAVGLGLPKQPPSDEQAILTRWRNRLTPELLAGADRAKGRTHYQQLCAACHRLNGEGGEIGPDLTGAARDNLNYLLENILFPSAVVAEGQQLATVTLNDGRVLAGLVRERTPTGLRLQTMTEAVAIAASDVAKIEQSAVSLMPPGLLDGISTPEARDLIAYLMQR